MARIARRNTATLGLLAAVAAGLLGCGGDGGEDDASAGQPAQAAPEPATVDIVASGYEPAKVRVLVGGTVTWVNRDEKADHTAQTAGSADPAKPGVESSEFDTHTLSWNEPYTVTFHQPGTYKYFCSFHEMNGVVEVVRRTPPSGG